MHIEQYVFPSDMHFLIALMRLQSLDRMQRESELIPVFFSLTYDSEEWMVSYKQNDQANKHSLESFAQLMFKR